MRITFCFGTKREDHYSLVYVQLTRTYARINHSIFCIIIDILTFEKAKGKMENFISILGGRMRRPKNLDLFSTIKFMEQLHVRIFVVTPVLSTPSPSLNSGILAIYKSIKKPYE